MDGGGPAESGPFLYPIPCLRREWRKEKEEAGLMRREEQGRGRKEDTKVPRRIQVGRRPLLLTYYREHKKKRYAQKMGRKVPLPLYNVLESWTHGEAPFSRLFPPATLVGASPNED